MTIRLPRLLSLVCLVVLPAAPLLGQEAGGAPTAAPATQSGDPRLGSGGGVILDKNVSYPQAFQVTMAMGAPARKVRHSYMGVGVEAAGDVLRAQLKIPAGTGLVITYVDPDGPAHDVIREHDVLRELDDQILCNPEQLITLVRLHKAGDTLHVTLTREAQRTTVGLTLREKEVSVNGDGAAIGTVPTVYGYPGMGQPVPVLSQAPNIQWLLPPNAPSPTAIGNAPVAEPAPVATQPDPVSAAIEARVGDWANTVSVATRTGPVTIDDGEVMMWLQAGKQGPDLTVINRADGQTLFHGPVGNAEQWEAVPKNIRGKFERWRGTLAAPAAPSAAPPAARQ